MAHVWPEVLDDLVERRRSALVGYAYVLAGDLASAEDLVHEAILRTFSKPRGLTSVPQAESYVRRAIATTFLNGVARRKRFVARMHLLADPVQSPPTDGAVEERDAVHSALLALSPRERACVVLRFYEDLTVPELAHELGISTGAAKRYLSDAAAKLRARLGDDFSIDGPATVPVAPRTPRRKP